jgi:hypothetical protein
MNVLTCNFQKTQRTKKKCKKLSAKVLATVTFSFLAPNPNGVPDLVHDFANKIKCTFLNNMCIDLIFSGNIDNYLQKMLSESARHLASVTLLFCELNPI